MALDKADDEENRRRTFCSTSFYIMSGIFRGVQRRIKPFIAFVAIICLLLGTSVVLAASEGITDIAVTRDNNDLLVSALYKGGFTPEIKSEIINGVSREFFYYIVLHRVIPSWLDEEKASTTIRYSVKYDTLKKQFHVTRDIIGAKEEHVFDSYDEMVEWVSRIDKVRFIPLKTLSGNHKYYVSIKAEIKAGKLPFLLRYPLFFIPYSEFSTEWAHSSEFMLKDFK